MNFMVTLATPVCLLCVWLPFYCWLQKASLNPLWVRESQSIMCNQMVVNALSAGSFVVRNRKSSLCGESTEKLLTCFSVSVNTALNSRGSAYASSLTHSQHISELRL